jgi:hypothetical protein
MYLQAMTHLQKCRIIYVARVANATGLRALGGSPITVKIYWVRSHGAMEPGALHLLFCRLRPPFTYCAERAATVNQDLLVTKEGNNFSIPNAAPEKNPGYAIQALTKFCHGPQ